jgi:acyl-CoA thioesterase FadM
VIHDLTIEHLRPIRYLDELAITTWVSDIQRVRSHREYLARNVTTNEMVACGRAYWAHLDSQTMMPARVPASIVEILEPNGVRAISRLKPRAYPLPAHLLPREHRVARRVQRYEADGMQHVNNAVYFDWLEEALADAVADISSPTRSLCVRRHDIKYIRSALPGDDVEIAARLVGAGRCASAWSLEITRAGEILVRDHITAFWRDENGKPQQFI